AICYQIEEAIPDCSAKAIRQVADSEGAILEKIQLLMILITALALIGSALGIMNLVAASVMERSQEIGLLKAVGAHDIQVIGLVLTEIMLTAVLGGVLGYIAGMGLAQIIGMTVFSSSIAITPVSMPLVAVLVLCVALIGSIPAIRMLVKMNPTEVLHSN
ncbi:MAG: FtsX-like permease family protein, partial [Oscillospiraceae bacterium]|nr:FtsX-like permease family protein [Oscillospiraceae bacterium]